MMRILLACEYSGIVRSAFESEGWDACSCDILPTELPGKHYQGDVMDIINDGWDMMIAFPPCTFLTYSGMNNWYDEGRAEKRIEAAKFFMQLYNSKVKHVCIENPQGVMSKIFRELDQTIHPYFFGERQMKRTSLWLKNLPKLKYQLKDDLFGYKTATEKPIPEAITFHKKSGKYKNRYFTDCFIVGRLKTGKEKSKSFSSIATEMAKQWTNILK